MWGKAFPMYFQYISHACWPRILPVYFHVFFFCWLVGPKFLRSISVFFCSRQTFYGFQVQVKNAASYLRTQLNAWCGSPAPQEGALGGFPRWFADVNISRSFTPSAKKYLVFSRVGFPGNETRFSHSGLKLDGFNFCSPKKLPFQV